MSKIPAWLVGSLRARTEEYLVDTCSKRGRAGTITKTSIPCSITPDTTPTRGGLDAELNMGVTSYILRVPYDESFAKDEKVVHGGHEYEVDELLDDRTPLIFRYYRIARVSR
jgi:hypothetical protein